MREPTPAPRDAGKWRDRLNRFTRTGGRRSIRTRVLAIALIPSAVLLITGAAVAGSLVSSGVAARNWADILKTAIPPCIAFEATVQQELATSTRALAGDAQARTELPGVRDRTNVVLSQLTVLAGITGKLNPEGVARTNAEFAELAAKLPVVRQGIDQFQVSPGDVDALYTGLGRAVMNGIADSARTTSHAAAAREQITTVDLFRVMEAHGRANGVAAVLTTRSQLTPAERVSFTQFTGNYRQQLEGQFNRLPEAEQARYNRLVGSDAWKVATAAEDSLSTTGSLRIPLADFRAAESEVATELLGLWSDHFTYGADIAGEAADTTLLQSILAGVATLLVAVTAFVVSVRLANALVRRLRRLRSQTMDLAEVQLPELVDRLHAGEQVDVDAAVTPIDRGGDEIGQVAEAFSAAQRTAIAAATAEARTRGGLNKVFLNIAHRSQVVVHRQLDVLDVAEAKQSDPEHLELLFQLDHLTTAARRNAENLLILGGSQPGRKWRNPVALEEVVRSAISETEDFARVSAVRLPEVKVVGTAVADILHLLAELVDNATSFSPPDAPVAVRGNLVGKGVVVEVEDQGLGIPFEEREELNERLRNPPDFQEMALAGQRNLGLFVIGTLARKHGIVVNLVDSAYGGIKAIVLIPAQILDTGEPEVAEPPEDGNRAGLSALRRARHARVPSFVPEAAPDPVPRLPRADADFDPRQWPQEEPALDAAPPAPRTRTVEERALPEGVAARAASPGRKPLPRRRRQAHLAPQLQAEQPSAPDAAPRFQLRSPDEARSTMSAFQRGTWQGRGSRDSVQ
ncbi:ATP-binding protein [Amycolatopsis endophytica]|uniref:histidine kinase n=1 Tax=Amycolatopsis endophytica TaxID=860233 RepID=A0A853B3V1_9PSEU|nr:nitrate- and nitrite sensing domain-containing protein [Amycolatopsis endophytica]NYI89487.1 signal transduction histidine kinase [Amycolatopsis endophytica]